jgi:Rhodopirellula transposase DDE domain
VDSDALRAKYHKLLPHLNERTRRLLAGADALALGRGGVVAVARASQLSRPTIYKAIEELSQKSLKAERVRREGGGRKMLSQQHPELDAVLERLVSPTSRGDPMNPLRWTIKSTRKLAQELQAQGYRLSHPVVAERLAALHYSLQANAKSIEEGSEHPDRNAQFEHINRLAAEFLAEGQPVISVDTKKKELVGRYKNSGREWRPQGQPIKVKVHDFIDESLGKAIPYGVYDVGQNQGWVNVGRDHDTSAFAVESIRQWWRAMAQAVYPQARRLLICADGGGSNGYRVRLWKKELQRLSDELARPISVCHYPPGTSKWNKIEHRLFSFISQNWRGKPLTSHEVVIELIASTTTRSGLKVRARTDSNKYPDKIKVSDAEMQTLNLERDSFHGEWNYTLKPHRSDC